MLKKTDDFIRKRIIWKAKKYSLPSKFSVYYDDLSHEVIEYLSQHVDVELTGTPLLYFTKPSKEWTLLCTRQLIGFDHLHVYSVSLNEIERLTSSKIEGNTVGERLESVRSIGKTEWDQLAVETKDSRHFLFHANKGADFFSLWNIALLAVRLNV